MWSNFNKSANHLNVTCRNKAILGSYLKQWQIFVNSGCNEKPKVDLTGGGGHMRQADLSVCFGSCIAFAAMLILLLGQRWLWGMPSPRIGVSMKWYWNRNIIGSDPSSLLGLYFHLEPEWRNKYMETESYSLVEKNFFRFNDIIQRNGFLYAAWNDHIIYTYYVKYICLYGWWVQYIW